VTAPTPDPRTPGQVLHESLRRAEYAWDSMTPGMKGEQERRAAAVLAHDAAARTARGEVVVKRGDVLAVLDDYSGRRDAADLLRAALDAQEIPPPDSSWVQVARP